VHTVVKAGQIVKVKVQEVDIQRKRIALTMRLQDAKPEKKGGVESRHAKGAKRHSNQPRSNNNSNGAGKTKKPSNNAMAAKLSAALKF